MSFTEMRCVGGAGSVLLGTLVSSIVLSRFHHLESYFPETSLQEDEGKKGRSNVYPGGLCSQLLIFCQTGIQRTEFT